MVGLFANKLKNMLTNLSVVGLFANKMKNMFTLVIKSSTPRQNSKVKTKDMKDFFNFQSSQPTKVGIALPNSPLPTRNFKLYLQISELDSSQKLKSRFHHLAEDSTTDYYRN